jgi:hypothetical protein
MQTEVQQPALRPSQMNPCHVLSHEANQGSFSFNSDQVYWKADMWSADQ